MQLDDVIIFILSEVASFKVRSEVINPAETATLTASEEPCFLGQRSPTAVPMLTYMSYESLIFLLGPRSLVCVRFFTAR